MLEQSFVSQISSEVADVRVQKGLDRKSLAKSSKVSVRFLRNLEEGIQMPWDRDKLVEKLIRVLKKLSLKDTARDVRRVVNKEVKKPKFTRMKYDKGLRVVLSTKGCRLR